MEKLNKLRKIDEVIAKIDRKMFFSAVNPVNINKEMVACFNNPQHDPQFKYIKYPYSLSAIKKRLVKMSIPKEGVGLILNEKRKELLNMTKMFQNRGNEKFTRWSVRVYSKPSNVLVKKARELLAVETKKSKKKIIKTPVSYLKDGLQNYKFDWDVKLAKSASSARVNLSKKKLLIKRGAKFSEKFLKRLIIHEIGTHILRAENGRLQPWRIFLNGFPGYIKTEEGLAVFNEEKAGILSDKTIKIYAGRVLAVNLALKHSFSEIYTEMLKHFHRTTAWKLTMRAKRGLGDTKIHGGCTKDHVYLKGYYEIKKYLEKGGDLNKLYYGKINLDHVNSLGKIEDLKEPLYYPNFN